VIEVGDWLTRVRAQFDCENSPKATGYRYIYVPRYLARWSHPWNWAGNR